MRTTTEDKWVAVSGGFDPIHRGHLELIDEASKYGKVLVLLNSDRFLKKKKGYCTFSFNDRSFILQHIYNVYSVIPVIDTDQTVCKTLRAVRPDIFVNGGDRDSLKTIPEAEVCRQLKIEMVFTGQEKVDSSSDIMRRCQNTQTHKKQQHAEELDEQ